MFDAQLPNGIGQHLILKKNQHMYYNRNELLLYNVHTYIHTV